MHAALCKDITEMQNGRHRKSERSEQRQGITAVNIGGTSLCWSGGGGEGLDCLLPITTICLQSEQGSEIERETKNIT